MKNAYKSATLEVQGINGTTTVVEKFDAGFAENRNTKQPNNNLVGEGQRLRNGGVAMVLAHAWDC